MCAQDGRSSRYYMTRFLGRAAAVSGLRMAIICV